MIFDNLLLATLMLEDLQLQSYKSSHLNPLNANPTKWSNTHNTSTYSFYHRFSRMHRLDG